MLFTLSQSKESKVNNHFIILYSLFLTLIITVSQKAGEVSIDVSTMLKEKDKVVGGLTSGIEMLFKKNKVTYAKGWASVSGKNEVKVKGTDGNESVINTKNIIIATGSDVAGLPGIKVTPFSFSYEVQQRNFREIAVFLNREIAIFFSKKSSLLKIHFVTIILD